MLGDRPGTGWPQSACSEFVTTRTHRWHVQRAGKGPGILLLHGTGASTHSWRGLFDALAEDADTMAIDLPGHGYTRPRGTGRHGLAEMALDIATLLAKTQHTPHLVIGHSAGGALALWLTHAHGLGAKLLLLNPALTPFRGLAGQLFPPLAKALALNPLSGRMIAGAASAPGTVRNLIDGTGSRIDDAGLEMYRQLIRDPAHIDGTLRMMAAWRLEPLTRALPKITTPTAIHIGEDDRTVPPGETLVEAARLPDKQIITRPGEGHLMHEETPAPFIKAARALL